MNVLIAGDSRTVWPMSDDIVVRFGKNNSEHDVKSIRAFYDHWLFSLHVLAEYLESQERFDLTILQAGWHEGVCHWTPEILKYITGHRFNPQALCEPTSVAEVATPPGIPATSQSASTQSFLYIDREYEQEVINLVKAKSSYCVFIGMHSLKHGNGLDDLHHLGIKHHHDVLRMNDAFSKLDIDMLHMPMDFNWVEENCGDDHLHYASSGVDYIVGFLDRYVDRISLTIGQIVRQSNPDFYDKAKLFGSAIANLTKESDVVLLSHKTCNELFWLFIGCILYKRIPLIVQRPSHKVRKEDFAVRMQGISESVAPAICFCEEEHRDEYGQYFKCISQIDSEEVLPEPEIKPDDIAFLQMSSGTTGVSKVVRITHKQIIAHCDEYAETIDFNSESIVVSWLPLYHDMGLVSSFLLPLLKGAQFHIIDPFVWLSSPGEILNMAHQHRATHVWMPSFAFNYITKNAELSSDIDLSSLTHVISCSEPTFHYDVIQFQEKFQKNNLRSDCLSVCYALAENVFAVSQSDGIRSVDHEGTSYVSCGQVIPGVSIIIEKDGEDVTNDSEGRVMMRSSYEPDTNIRSDFHGYYDTGDIGFMKDQELYIMGRTKDSFVSYGVNVYPELIEHEVSKMDGVIDGRVACFGVFSEQSGTHECHICAEAHCLDLENPISLRVKEVFNLSPSVSVVSRGFLTKTSSGKINRSNTKKRIINSKKVLDTVNDFLNKKGKGSVAPADRLHSSGILSSIEMFELILYLEQEGWKSPRGDGLDLPIEKIDLVFNLCELQETLAAPAPAPAPAKKVYPPGTKVGPGYTE